MADAALQRARLTFAIKALIYYAVSCIVNGMAFSYFCRQILSSQCLPQGPDARPSPLLANLAYAMTHNFWLSFLAHLTLLNMLDMAFRLVGSIAYLLDWVVLAYPTCIRLPRLFANKGQAVVRTLVTIIPWAMLALFALLVLFGTAKGLTMFATSRVWVRMPTLLWVGCVIYLLMPLIIVCRVIGMHYMAICLATARTVVFCRSCLAAPGHGAARIVRNITRPEGQIRLLSGDEDHHRAYDGTIAL